MKLVCRGCLPSILEEREISFTRSRDKATKRCQTSRELLDVFISVRGFISNSSLILSWLGSIPLSLFIYLKNFPDVTPNEQFSRLSFILLSLKLNRLNVPLRLFMDGLGFQQIGNFLSYRQVFLLTECSLFRCLTGTNSGSTCNR
ncbi:hypothetical protein LIER_37084 [Lithospermum erythrorhizon]|uniref:Uncharacterized protein n=1 Tax=Lithospermum erythrorhizon TaxID=34254 RepID=A0AAV3PGJ6_LITER